MSVDRVERGEGGHGKREEFRDTHPARVAIGRQGRVLSKIEKQRIEDWVYLREQMRINREKLPIVGMKKGPRPKYE